MPRSVRAEWTEHPGLGRAYGAAVFLPAYLGLTLLLGDAERISAAAFDAIRATGGSVPWSVVLLALAAALTAAAVRGRRWGASRALFGAAFVYAFMATWFWLAAWNNDAASYWGAGQFLVFCWWHVSQALEYAP